ncbi:hypothetical protein F7725_021538 [Dissostichus mawsoni]|uniref:HAT C-terminal dimerisation domain-containing protein n=1 Tax=Dissostichus mawsoni TaxID=36200 RepID=A0A7J5ZDQ1_DISMA|nr:hypothetical protein F7725_021538 [Dissostichus mawsoni]
MVRCGLVDGGKVVKPHIDSPTWRNSRGMAKRSLNLSTGRTIPVFFSDHDGLLFRVDLDAQTFGPGYWRLNGVLGLKPLCQGILEWWEVAKDRIKTFCLGYCKMKARRSKREVSQLQRLLEREYAKGNCGATINQNVCDSLKARLRHVAEGKARAFLARSRAEFIEQSETCSAAFFSSVRAKKARQVVTGIRDSQGIVVTEDGQMVRVATDHFRDSFKEKEGLNGLEQLGAQGGTAAMALPPCSKVASGSPGGCRADVKLNHRALYKEAREKINVGPVIGIPSKVWRRIQPKGLDNRLKDLNWLCLLRCLPVREIMHRHGLARSPVCPRPDCKDEDTIRHVIIWCFFPIGGTNCSTAAGVFFGLNAKEATVCLTLFSSAEEVARVLQSKDLSAETVKSAVQMLQTHYTNLRSTDVFHSIFEEAQRTNMSDLVQAPALPPRRRAPRRYDDGDASHQWENPEDYFRSQFNQPTLQLLMSMEQVLLTAVNSPPGFGSINIPQNLVDMYTGDIDMERLSTQLSLFPAVLQAHNSSSAAERPIMQVTKVSTITDMLAAQGRGTQSLFSEVDKLLRLYLTVPMSNATAERSFSSLRRLKTFLRSTMSERRLNHLLFLHIHKDLTDGLDLKKCSGASALPGSVIEFHIWPGSLRVNPKPPCCMAVVPWLLFALGPKLLQAIKSLA